MITLVALREQCAAMLATIDRALAAGDDVPAAPPLAGLALDPGAYRAYWHGDRVALTHHLFETLACLVEHPGHVKTRQQIIDYVYPVHQEIAERQIDTMIRKIRGRFRRVDPEFNALNAISGVGYIWETTA